MKKEILAWLSLMALCGNTAFAAMPEKPEGRAPAADVREPARTQTEQPRPAIELSRGQLLYENHCQGCHRSTLHLRRDRKAKSPREVRAWVVRWAGELRLPWSAEEMDDVADYLERRFYRFGRPDKTR